MICIKGNFDGITTFSSIEWQRAQNELDWNFKILIGCTAQIWVKIFAVLSNCLIYNKNRIMQTMLYEFNAQYDIVCVLFKNTFPASLVKQDFLKSFSYMIGR